MCTDQSSPSSTRLGCGGGCDPEDIEDGVSDDVLDHVEDEAKGEAGHHTPHPFLGLALALQDAPDLENVAIQHQGNIVLRETSGVATTNKEKTFRR